MIAQSSINLIIQHVHKSDFDAYHIHVDESKLIQWCTSLCMLRYSIVDTITIQSKDTTLIVQLNVELNMNFGNERGRVINFGEKPKVEISTPELDLWIRFYLSQLQHGKVDIEHVDVDLRSSDESNLNTLYIILH